ncbi:hypothetical protein GQ53DRAFT_71964 [Thozetella sp. PMI_491]|nr:hypothetical protein GQ53DRAFT_71964 [Thozetella sp. PMI_491]
MAARTQDTCHAHVLACVRRAFGPAFFDLETASTVFCILGVFLVHSVQLDRCDDSTSNLANDGSHILHRGSSRLLVAC